MKLQDVIEKLYPPQGITTVLAASMSGETDPIRHPTGKTLAEIETELAQVRLAQEGCHSDWAWWGYEGQLSYLESYRDLLLAADITGPDNLPYVPFPSMDGVVMDNQSALRRFGKQVLMLAAEAPHD